ncbi:pathogen-related protein-like [Vitis riparia]|uniref:pathogen-related protein-like n=1 Tax=Vitis riparia TaxID=96939 RepID=UPI00155AAF65|nr:pathogen-related protein-like [Vitis riparia]
MASSVGEGDKYRSHLDGEEEKNTEWRYGAPPNYEVVNKLFEEGRTKIWPAGSLEEKVQNLVKTWEMEMFHKVNLDDYKTTDPKKYTFNLNGREPMNYEEIMKNGGYNPLLQTSLPENLRVYNPADETAQSSHLAFTTTFPRGFALEILHVYSGPPVIKGHAPTGEMVEFFGMAVLELDERMKIVKVEFFYDSGDLLGGLVKGPTLDSTADGASAGCPVLRNTG